MVTPPFVARTSSNEELDELVGIAALLRVHGVEPDYGISYASAALALAALPRHDAVVALTTPRLVAVAGLVAKTVKGSLGYWLQDLYLEVAVAFGALPVRSAAARALPEPLRRVGD